jgi:hypothetical protein
MTSRAAMSPFQSSRSSAGVLYTNSGDQTLDTYLLYVKQKSSCQFLKRTQVFLKLAQNQ